MCNFFTLAEGYLFNTKINNVDVDVDVDVESPKKSENSYNSENQENSGNDRFEGTDGVKSATLSEDDV